jgi:hypothetical protein
MHANEFASGAARFRRGHARHSGGERRVKPCQGAVREQEGGGVRIRDREGAGAYCRSTTISLTSGGAAGSGSGGLAAMGKGFGEGNEERTGGLYRRGFVGEGQKISLNR